MAHRMSEEDKSCIVVDEGSHGVIARCGIESNRTARLLSFSLRADESDESLFDSDHDLPLTLSATTTQLRNIQGQIVSKYRYDMNAFSLVSP